jgi:hypothetical protein
LSQTELEQMVMRSLRIEKFKQATWAHKKPLSLGNWYMIVRLEKLLPAQLNEAMRQRLLQAQFEAWLQAQIQQLGDRDKV